MRCAVSFLTLAGVLAWGEHALAQSLASSLELVAYPSGGQATSKQSIDEQECYEWAGQTTGVDPVNPAAGVEPVRPAATPGKGVSAGERAVKGALLGALLGNIADEDAGEYALAGAAVGSVRGAKKADEASVDAQNQATAESQAEAARRLELFKKAFAACMEGRDYTVK
jgi:hypothetical protein